MEEIKLTGQSPDIVKENVDLLKKLFPEIVSENKIDFEKLLEVLGEYTEKNVESYRFTWYGKTDALRRSQNPSTGTLRPCIEESKDWDTTQNLYIEGDNLEVLKLLQKSYSSRIKVIYIDPPYNKDKDFIYPDKWKDPIQEYKRITGQIDEKGNVTSSDTEDEGGRHTRWLNMMYPRLRLAKNLLTDDGVVFISIDDEEIENLKKICNEIFGEENFIANLVWQQGRKSSASAIAINHEYCLVYGKNKDIILEKNNQFKRYWMEKKEGLDIIYKKEQELRKKYGSDYKKISSELKRFYKEAGEESPVYRHKHYHNVDARGIYFAADTSAPDKPESRSHRPLIHPVTLKPTNVPKLGWRYTDKKLDELVAQDRIHFGDDETKIPCVKRYLKETEYEVASSVFYKDGRGASKRLENLLGGKFFDFPKDEHIIAQFINYCIVKEDGEAYVLDFFSGSATTAHAVMELNASDGGKRKFIMVQLPEPIEENSEAYRAGYKNICEIGKERIRRAGEMIKEELREKYRRFKQNPDSCLEYEDQPLNPENLDVGFKVFKLDSSNLKKWSLDVGENFYQLSREEQNAVLSEKLGFEVDNFVEGRSELDVVYEIMLKYGLDLTYPVETVNFKGKNVYIIGYGGLIVCLDSEITQDLAEDIVELVKKLEPSTVCVAVRDLSFVSDSAKLNFKETLKNGIYSYFDSSRKKANKQNQFKFITI